MAYNVETTNEIGYIVYWKEMHKEEDTIKIKENESELLKNISEVLDLYNSIDLTILEEDIVINSYYINTDNSLKFKEKVTLSLIK